jgi:hypothetical protein
MSQELELLAGVGAYRQRYKLSVLTLQFPRRQSILIYAKNVDNHHEKILIIEEETVREPWVLTQVSKRKSSKDDCISSLSPF